MKPTPLFSGSRSKVALAVLASAGAGTLAACSGGGGSQVYRPEPRYVAPGGATPVYSRPSPSMTAPAPTYGQPAPTYTAPPPSTTYPAPTPGYTAPPASGGQMMCGAGKCG
jgi:hypothetical protein